MAPSKFSFNTVQREKNFRNLSKETLYPDLQKLTEVHIEAFNNLFGQFKKDKNGNTYSLMDLSIKNMLPVGFLDQDGNKVELWISNVVLDKCLLPEKHFSTTDRKIYPSECREGLRNYSGNLSAEISMRINDGPVTTMIQDLGPCPIMVKSNLCHLHKMGPQDLVKYKEESEDFGGYFILNGIEKIIRLLIAPKRNHVIVLNRPSLTKRGAGFSTLASVIRCVNEDETSITLTMHYLNDGNCMAKFYWKKIEYLIPAVLLMKALVPCSDKEIFDALVQNDLGNSLLLDRVEIMLRSFKSFNLYSQEECLKYLGNKFRVAFSPPDWYSDKEVGELLIKNAVLVHLKDNRDKFNLLCYMIRKVYAVASNEASPDNPDSPQNHEVLLGGHLFGNIIKERLYDFLVFFKRTVLSDLRMNPARVNIKDDRYIKKVLAKCPGEIGDKLRYFLATGNLVSRSGLDQSQFTGYTIIAEKLNFLRYISHFQCIHRGAFFAELKTTSVRKLLPEAWGFMCPVHTPDGSPCGLLNHLSHKCKITTQYNDVSGVPAILAELGMSQLVNGCTNNPKAVTVQLDGRIVGWCSPAVGARIAKELRHLKVEGNRDIPLDLEIGFVPPSNGGQYPGLFLFSTPSRMSRPVKYLANGKTDIVGPFEQVYMDIACLKEDIVPGITTHMDFHPTDILSTVANLTPFSDFNQSPRNMYQCQMGKQTMGTPAQALKYRSDNKLYRLQTGQTPIVRPNLHNAYGMDEFPNGTNAVVAVISYTGYDMEDAMILNKGAHERGFGYGTIYKTENVDLNEFKDKRDPMTFAFGLGPNPNPKILEHLDPDGLPRLGTSLKEGDPFFAFHNTLTGKVVIKRYKSTETGIVDEVKLLSNPADKKPLEKIQIRLRVPRPPVIGDKFSSRHGQKGVCSMKLPSVDMPFSESGIQPDVIINPHAFPSRMTIGMFVESLAAKAGALHGVAQDATPFQFNEDFPAADYFGEQLLNAGYSYHGNEPMYSGITGEEFHADIYLGIVYYQRLRHMVSDKYQVRTTGPVNSLTMQPLKGRKNQGGIRFGEMERDSLLAHGTSFLLQDRLMNCSDYSQCHVCRKCSSIVSPISVAPTTISASRTVTCRLCNSEEHIDVVALPYVFRYLTSELMAMNIKLEVAVRE